MKSKLIHYLTYLIDKFNIGKTNKYISLIIQYWGKITNREKALIIIAILVLMLFILISIIQSMININNNLEKNNIILKKNQQYALVLSKEYKDLVFLPKVEFSPVSIKGIKTDIQEILSINNPDVKIQDTTLYITIPTAKFQSIIIFLDKLRINYGIFPKTLKIIRLIKSGYVYFNASFTVENNE